MKSFEKWWFEHRAPEYPQHICQSARGETLAMLADKEVWMAALEWVLEEISLRRIDSYELEEAIKAEVRNE